MTARRPQSPAARRTEIVEELRQRARSRAAAFIGLADIGGRTFITDSAVSAVASWKLSGSVLDGRSSRHVFDLPTLWESLESRRFSSVSERVFVHGPGLLPDRRIDAPGAPLCAPVMSDRHLLGFFAVWPYAQDAARQTVCARLNTHFETLAERLLPTLPTSDVRDPVGRSALLDASTGLALQLDRLPHHPLLNPDVASGVKEVVRSMAGSVSTATATAHGWHLRLHRLGDDHIAARMMAMLPVRIPVTEVLTPHQRQVTTLAVQGCTSAQIGHMLDIPAQTVRSHLKTAFRRLGVHNRTQLANLLQREML